MQDALARLALLAANIYFGMNSFAGKLEQRPPMMLDSAAISYSALAAQLHDFSVPSYPTVTGPVAGIHARSILYAIGALAWAWALLVSFTGWGRFLSAKLARVPALPASIACTLGIATVVFLGGLLNWVHLLSAPVLIGIVLVGLLLYAALYGARPTNYAWERLWRSASCGARILLIVAAVILLVRTAGTLRLGMFNNLDDGAAYMVFAHKMLATHHFAADPFSDRRVISSLGGAYLLQAMGIAGTSLSSMGLADRTLGLLLLFPALLDVGAAFSLAAWQIGLLELAASLVPQQTINLSFIILPTSLLLAMVWLLRECGREDTNASRYAALAGMTGAAVISLKSTFLPCVGMFSVLPYFFLLPRNRRTAIRYAAITVAAGFLLLLPWMAAMRMTSGTWLFPILGHGVDYSSYGLLPPQIHLLSRRTWIKIFLQAIALGILAVVLLASRIRGRDAQLGLGILASAAIAITVFNYKSGGDFIWRYNFPQFFCAVLIFYAVTAAVFQKSRTAYACGMIAVFAMIFYYDAAGTNPRPFRDMRIERGDYHLGLRASLTGQALASPQIRAEYAAAEAALPLHVSAIENTAYPFLFSYRDRTIFLADWPGAASPKPGWPFNASAESLPEYLRTHKIRYLIDDYEYARWFDMEGCTAMLSPDRNSQELIALWRLGVVAHHQFQTLRQRYRSIYDDGKIAVIDLQQPLANAAPESDTWTLDTPVETMCSAVFANYQAHPLVTNAPESDASQ